MEFISRFQPELGKATETEKSDPVGKQLAEAGLDYVRAFLQTKL